MKQIKAFAIFIFFSAAAFAQIKNRPDFSHTPPAYQADVSISSVKFENYISPNSPDQLQAPGIYQIDRPAAVDSPLVKCTITLHNGSNHDANETVLVAIVPLDIVLISYPPNATQHKSGLGSDPPYPGYITFNIGQIKAGQNITVNFAFIRSPNSNKVSTYTYSIVPDPNPANNYKDASF